VGESKTNHAFGLASLVYTVVVISIGGDFYHSAVRRDAVPEASLAALLTLLVVLIPFLVPIAYKRIRRQTIPRMSAYLGLSILFCGLFLVDCCDAIFKGSGWYVLFFGVATIAIIWLRRRHGRGSCSACAGPAGEGYKDSSGNLVCSECRSFIPGGKA